MADLRLFDAGTPAFGVDGNPNSFELGNNFTSPAGGMVSEVSWYRADTVSGHRPALLRLWDRQAQAVVATAPSVPDDGAIGWQRVALTTPVTVVGGRTYTVAAQMPPASWAAIAWGSTAPNPTYPLEWGVPSRAYSNANTTGFPLNTDSNTVFGLDVTFQPSAGSPSVLTADDVRNELADWLDTSDGTQAHSAPLEDHATLTTVAAQVDATNSKAQGATGFDAIKAVADAVAAAVSGLPGTIAGAVTTITGQLTSMAGADFSSATNSLVAITNRVLASYDHALDVLAGDVTFPGASARWRWVAGTPVDFDGAIALAVPADAYVLDLTTLPRGLALNDSAGVHVVYRAGWWCPLNDTIGEERHFVDFEHTRLVAAYGRMAGCLVQLGPEGTGTITPYTLEPI